MSQLSLDLSPSLDYRLVVSARAKRLSLRVEPGRGLIVTVPKRFPRREVPAFVEQNREWVESALADIDRNIPERYRQWPPLSLELRAIDQTLKLAYLAQADHAPVSANGFGMDESNTRSIALGANPSEKSAVATEIANILVDLARSVLPGRLATHAQAQGLTYKRVQIRGQRTVWGSYSSSGTLSLNYKLLFLRPALLDYVLLHELAHTRFLDHSADFWRFLETMHPAARKLDAELAKAGLEVPPWLELAG